MGTDDPIDVSTGASGRRRRKLIGLMTASMRSFFADVLLTVFDLAMIVDLLQQLVAAPRERCPPQRLSPHEKGPRRTSFSCPPCGATRTHEVPLRLALSMRQLAGDPPRSCLVLAQRGLASEPFARFLLRLPLDLAALLLRAHRRLPPFRSGHRATPHAGHESLL